MIKTKCKSCGTLNDINYTENCEVCETKQEWLFTCDKHQDVVFLTKRKKCPICDLLHQLQKMKKYPQKKTAVKKVFNAKKTQKNKRPFKSEKRMPLTKFQLRRLIKLGIDESSAKELSKVEAFEMISKLVGYTK